MPPYLQKVERDAAGGLSRLFLDFTTDPSKGLPPYLSGVGGTRDFWLQAMEGSETASRGEDAATWVAVIDEIVSQSQRLGTRDDVLDKVRAAGRREAFFVVTGQQPGAFGGPLMTLYKVIAAVILARRVETLTLRPCVPLYWCGGDDTDFQEIRGLSLVTRESTPISTAIPQQAHSAGMPTGSVGTAWLAHVWKNVRRFVDEFESGAFVSRVVEGAFEKATDHGGHASAVLVGLVGGGIAVVDGRSVAVRRHAQRIIADYVAHEEEIKQTVASEGRRLTQQGYHSQLSLAEGSGIFIVENGVRKTVTSDLRQVLIDAARTDVGRCSPGVVARNLVQDGALRPIAAVLGPAEIAYRAQIGALYPRFGVSRPVPVPRLSATFVHPELGKLLAGGQASAVATMLKDPSEFVRAICEHSVPPSIRRAAREFEREIGESVERYSHAIDEAAPRTASRVKTRLADLKSRTALAAAAASDVGKVIALERWPFLSDLAAFTRPGGKPQERTVSALVPFLFGGKPAVDDLLSVGATHVDDLLDGRTSHVVYSSPS